MNLANKLLLCFAIMVALTLANTAFVFHESTLRTPDRQYAIRTPTRQEINIAVVKLLLAGRGSELYAFYAYEVGDPLKASLYTQSALEGDGVNPAPVNLIISIGWWEGGHVVDRIDGPNPNGTYDVRPMGLNTKSYRMYSVSDLKRMEVNIPKGVAHLVNERESWGISWEAALASYNKGSPKGLDADQIDYVSAILRHEWELDRKFAARFPDAF